jgi:RES domain-containing protein
MILYRLTNGGFIKDLSGNGSKLYGGRWNSVGFNAIYTTENISLAILEILVHVNKYKRPLDYHLIYIEIPEKISTAIIDKEKLKRAWKTDISYSQFIGDEFLKSSNELLLKVPSAIVDEENNFIINPKHPDIAKVKITTSKIFEFDERLYLKNE